MNRLSALIIFITFAFACATQPSQPTLKNYQTKSPDEAKIIDLILEFQNAYDTQSFVKILAVYSHDAMIQTSTGQKDWAGVMLSKVEHANKLVKQIKFYQKRQIKLEIAPPQTIQVQGDEAHMTSTYELYARNPPKAYTESGVINFEFKKIASGWLVCKRTWEVKECNHPDFKEWKAKQK
jgi:ketosteroid isomerase-like protein